MRSRRYGLRGFFAERKILDDHREIRDLVADKQMIIHPDHFLVVHELAQLAIIEPPGRHLAVIVLLLVCAGYDAFATVCTARTELGNNRG